MRCARPGTTQVIVGAVVVVVAIAALDTLRSSKDDGASPAMTTSPAERQNRMETVISGRPDPAGGPFIGTISRSEGGIPVSLTVTKAGWEAHDNISINKNVVGPQGAEAIVFWASFPAGDSADPCPNLLSPSIGPTLGNLAAAVVRAPGIELVRGPTTVSVGGRPAKHMVLTVRQDVGCHPGFFYAWRETVGGAYWGETKAETINVWIVEVDGTRLFIEAQTSKDASPELQQEIEEIVGSIRFG